MRQSWDDYFFQAAKLVSTRSTCLHRQYGAVLVRGKHIISSGFNGAPAGYPHCTVCAREGVPSGEKLELCKAVHAEQNCIATAARYGISTFNTALYLYPGDIPCPLCTKLLINAGISKIYYTQTDYPGFELSKDYINWSNIILVKH